MKDNNSKSQSDSAPVSNARRSFLGRSALITSASAALPILSSVPQHANAAVISKFGPKRRNAAFDLRMAAAFEQRSFPPVAHPDNGDEAAFSAKLGTFTKGLPHNRFGEVDRRAYKQLKRALRSADADQYEAIPMGGTRKLANPQATHAYSLSGADSHMSSMPAAPSFSSKREVAEIVEVYWQALLRDVPFDDYPSHPGVSRAVADLNQFGFFRRRYRGAVTSENLFRGETPGDLTGPYISQFLLKPVPYGAMTVDQRYTVDAPGLDFMTDYAEWLEVQRGNVPSEAVVDQKPRYINDGRRLGSYVHTDFTYQAYLNAALIITSGLGINPWDSRLPYDFSSSQGRFVTFGGADLLSLIARVAHEALKAAWFQKWQVHLRLRPETFGGRIHNHLTGDCNYPIHRSLHRVNVFGETYAKTGSYLLPMAYVEGSPTHPAYPAGHACIAGACVTLLKAFFDEEHPVPSPVVAGSYGLRLHDYQGDTLTIGGELNKLAANVALGRDIAGVHWRTDGTEGLLAGEQVAVRVLQDVKRCYNEPFDGFSFRGFGGQIINV